RKRKIPVRYRAVAQLRVAVGEQQIAAAAHTHQLPPSHIHHVLVRVGDRLRAHLAPLSRGFGPAPVSADAGQNVVGAGHAGAPNGSAGTAMDSTPSRSSS